MDKHQILYNQKLAKEWIDWVESKNPKGSREKEIYSLIKTWIKTIKPKKVVDIGCGQGICSTFISKYITYVGVDQSETLIERARKLYKSPNRKFILGDAYNIPLENNSTDTAISIWVWSHLKDLKKSAKEIHRRRSPQGT